MANQDNRSVEDLLVTETLKDMIEDVIKDIPAIKRIAFVYDITNDDGTEESVCRTVGFSNDYEKIGFLASNMNTLISGNYEDIGDGK